MAQNGAAKRRCCAGDVSANRVAARSCFRSRRQPVGAKLIKEL
jgi:hypothetical protein